MLAWRQARLLRRSVAALARHRTEVDFETVILLNGAGDQVRWVAEETTAGATIVRSSVNLGFGGGCNRAVKAARGEYLVLLNDDTEVDDGWLDALVETADRHPEAGAVGSRVRDPLGNLQEAGGILWSDGSIWHVGRMEPESTPRYRHLRRVDYCSACALLVRRDTWDAVGGFDERFFPGYYEDLDMCLNIDAMAQIVLYQPRAEVMHHGGGDTGSLNTELKSLVARRSREHFLGKWHSALARYPTPPSETPPHPKAMPVVERAMEQARHLPLRALVLDERPEHGDPHAIGMIEGLVGSGYSVSVGAATGAGQAVRNRLGDHGVDVIEDLGLHIRGPIGYDAVLVVGHRLYDEWSSLLASAQPQAVVVVREPSDPDGAELGAGHWADTLDAARRAHGGTALGS